VNAEKRRSVWLALALLIMVVAVIAIPYIPVHSFYQTILIVVLFLGPLIPLKGIEERNLRSRLFLCYLIAVGLIVATVSTHFRTRDSFYLMLSLHLLKPALVFVPFVLLGSRPAKPILIRLFAALLGLFLFFSILHLLQGEELFAPFISSDHPLRSHVFVVVLALIFSIGAVISFRLSSKHPK
jgi:hypothetical protein